MMLGLPVYWSSKSQRCIALSTCEAEYNALAEAAKQSIYIHDFCSALGLSSNKATVVYNDNQAALKIANSKPGEHHPRSKHYAIKLAYLQDLITNNSVELRHHPSRDMPADMLTKAVGRARVIELLKLLNLSDTSSSIKGRVEEYT
jgi:hypothetical protein